MAHDHNHSHTNNKKILLISFIIITVYMLVEVVGGVLTKSLAILSDAGHMLSDSASLAIALLAFTLGERAASYGKTYGYKRFEVLAALLNGVTLVVIALIIFYESINRFLYPPEIASVGMLIISFIGLLVNILVAWIMMRGSDTKENLNMRGAFLHVLSDMLGSVGAIVAAILIMLFDARWADPLASIIVAVLVLRSGYILTKRAVHILMEGAPPNKDLNAMVNVISQIPEVKNVHDVHAWTITSDFHAFTCHIVVEEHLTVQQSTQVILDVENILKLEGIHHVTVQIEPPSHNHHPALLCPLNMIEKDAHDHDHVH